MVCFPIKAHGNPLGLVKGLNEVCKALDRKEALLCVLAENCADAKYKKLITVSIFPHLLGPWVPFALLFYGRILMISL